MLRPYKRMYSVADLRPGQAIEVEGQPYLILSAKFGRKSQGKANNVTKLRNLKTGSVISKTFSGADQITKADVGYKHVQFLYKSAEMFTFMDLNDYNQFDLLEESVGESKNFLVDGLELDVLTFDDLPIAVRLPATVDLLVKETIPGVRGDTAQGGTKPATLESGLTVHVPLFISEGERVRVNTERSEYVERA